VLCTPHHLRRQGQGTLPEASNVNVIILNPAHGICLTGYNMQPKLHYLPADFLPHTELTLTQQARQDMTAAIGKRKYDD